jgi:RimJ/RimL family protein N-acetyltransferase
MTETLVALGMLVQAHRAAGWMSDREPHWWIHQILVGNEVVGDAGFHGPPAPGSPVEVEVGYNVVPDLRGRGIASQACAQLLQWAWRDGAVLVRAETDPANRASQRVLTRCGFVAEPGFRYRVRRPAPEPGVGLCRS